MTTPKHRASINRPPRQESPRTPLRGTQLSTDSAIIVPTAHGQSLPLMCWDRWFALIAAKDYGGNLDRLA
jgi:hypothetical protein